ncbi:acetyl-CoA acetyltransferase [Actinocorallia herbida]|uniref:Acetyl-CoA acetyltransferase n=1 Tax=Actinocorallia herbida TaxID=58109 RepID=A0A3N1D8P4_9ACTN|nr:lipid-transfer protein [Actinocorallia herbida]ROO89917.1 acetyl-CoA acetyltransferase [Actinocorallia herbida]
MSREIAVVGTGMHPWGKWGKNFVGYGLHAAREALAEAGLEWTDVQYVAGADTIRNGYPGFIAGATFAQALGWSGARVSSSYAACASGAQAIANARAQILAGLADVALVVGADAAPKGFFAPVGGDRPDDPDWLRFRLLGATNPLYFALAARRRMALYGSTSEDFALVKVKNAKHGAANPNARYRKETSVAEVLDSPIVASPLHLMEICATSDGGAALILTSMEFARARGLNPVRIAGLSTVTPTFPKTVIDLPDFATDAAMTVAEPARPFRADLAHTAYEEAGVAPADISVAEVYDLSTALELDWMEDIGLCAPGEAESLLRAGETAIGGRIPVNPSGGLASFGEAVPAQAIAQICELTRQLTGRAESRQVPSTPTTAIAVNQGLFGHGSATILTT